MTTSERHLHGRLLCSVIWCPIIFAPGSGRARVSKSARSQLEWLRAPFVMLPDGQRSTTSLTSPAAPVYDLLLLQVDNEAVTQ